MSMLLMLVVSWFVVSIPSALFLAFVLGRLSAKECEEENTLYSQEQIIQFPHQTTSYKKIIE